MNKVDSIARRIMGWKLNRADRWFDYERGVYIYENEFQPEQNLDHAMQIIEKLARLGYTYTIKGNYEVCFNDVCAKGDTLAQAITNAAYSIIERTSIVETGRVWQQLC